MTSCIPFVLLRSISVRIVSAFKLPNMHGDFRSQQKLAEKAVHLNIYIHIIQLMMTQFGGKMRVAITWLLLAVALASYNIFRAI
jgi:hypothetical protein